MEHILHVGYHKTGSTYLQRHIFPGVRGAVFGASNRVIKALTTSVTEDEIFLPSTFRAALGEVGDRVLISRENLIGSPWHGSVPADERARRLATVMPSARVVIVVRDPSELRRSLYAQYINEGGFLSPEAFRRRVLCSAYMDLGEGISNFRRHFDAVLVLDFSLLRTDRHEFLARFADFAGVELPTPTSSTRSNPSLRGWRLEVLRRWNGLFRASQHNPSPPVPLPGAGRMRRVLQGQVE